MMGGGAGGANVGIQIGIAAHAGARADLAPSKRIERGL